MSLVFPPIDVGPALWDWSRCYIFGVVNVTPDSFSDGGRWASCEAAVAHALALAAAGADALDIGGESTRPGAVAVPVEEELGRVLPVIEALAPRVRVPISIDTYKAEVARRAIAAGASIVNDISGMTFDDDMARAVAETGATVILGHVRARPPVMQEAIAFDDVVAEVADELRAHVRRAVNAGIRPEKIWVDPGIGFGKTAEHSLRLIQECGTLRAAIGYPLMVGPSRKAFVGAVTGQPAGDRLMGTCAAAAIAVSQGADAVRLHDVGELASAIRVAEAIRRGGLERARGSARQSSARQSS